MPFMSIPLLPEFAESTRSNDFSRRQVISWMAALAAVSTLSLVGCGGNGWNNPGTNLKALTATIELPSGVVATDLIVSCSRGPAAISAAQFGIEVLANVPSLVMALNANDFKVCQMALVDPNGGSPTLGPRSSAIALIYLGIGGSMFSDAARKTFLDDIAASSAVDDLASEIALAQASDPYALSNGSSALKAKVKSTIQGYMSRPSARAKGESRDGLPSYMIIDPPTDVEGLTVVQGSTDLQYLVQNTKRRQATMMTYVVSHEAESGTVTNEATPRAVGAPLYIPATRNILNLPYGWSQVSSSPAAIALEGADVKTNYKSVIINTAFNAAEPSFYSDPRYASHVQTWREEAARLRQTGIVHGLVNMVLEVMGLGSAVFSYQSVAALIPTFVSGTEALEAAMTAAAAGNIFYEFVLQELMENFTLQQIFFQELPILEPLIAQVDAVRAAELAAAESGAAAVQLIRAGLLVLIALGIMEVADVIAVAVDTHGGNAANIWSLTAFQPQITLTPAHGTYTPGSTREVSVNAPGIGTQGVTYQWVLSGSSLANISDGTNVGTSITSTSRTVTIATTPSTNQELTLTVTVRKNGEVVGTATGTYTKQTGLPVHYVSWLRPSFHDGVGVYYMEMMLKPTERTRVRLTAVNNRPEYGGARASMIVSLPPITEPIYPVTQEIVAAQNINLTQWINQGYITNMTYTDDRYTPSNAFRLVAYGDRVNLWLSLAIWYPEALPDSGLATTEAEARRRAEESMSFYEWTVEFL